MSKAWKFAVSGIVIFVLAGIFVYIKAYGQYKPIDSPFTENEAISMVIRTHQEFPGDSKKVITRKEPTGGPEGAYAYVKYNTNIYKVNNDQYTVVLIKDWGMKVNGIYVKSTWEYSVTREGTKLVRCDDYDYLADVMK